MHHHRHNKFLVCVKSYLAIKLILILIVVLKSGSVYPCGYVTFLKYIYIYFFEKAWIETVSKNYLKLNFILSRLFNLIILKFLVSPVPEWFDPTWQCLIASPVIHCQSSQHILSSISRQNIQVMLVSFLSFSRGNFLNYITITMCINL